MRSIKIAAVLGLLLAILPVFSQVENPVKDGMVSIATLVVDYKTFEYEKVHLGYYNCASCTNDSLPFSTHYVLPSDFGSVAFTLPSTEDTIFAGGIVWSGRGEISHPKGFDTVVSDTFKNSPIGKPDKLKYFNVLVSKRSDSINGKIDSAWAAIDSLTITAFFADAGLKAGIYLYTPTVGIFDPAVAKWIVFFYHNDGYNSTDENEGMKPESILYPNPAAEVLNIVGGNSEFEKYRIYNASGQLVRESRLLGAETSLGLQDICPGLCLLQIISKEGVTVHSESFIKR